MLPGGTSSNTRDAADHRKDGGVVASPATMDRVLLLNSKASSTGYSVSKGLLRRDLRASKR